MSKRAFFLLVSFWSLAFAPNLPAQTGGTGDQSPYATGTLANYRYAEVNELTITVSIVGPVIRPGRYEVSRTVNLLDLISLAGGWTERADLTDVEISRISAASKSYERHLLRVDLDYEKPIKEEYLRLQNGDVISIGYLSQFDFRDVVAMVGALGVLLTAILVGSSR